jgi:N-acetylglutamate synthase-like GNAT family acetyltransferase
MTTEIRNCDFIVAEREGELIGVAGLEVYGASALLRSVAFEDSWQNCPSSAVVMRKSLGRDRR